eukprot:254061_1
MSNKTKNKSKQTQLVNWEDLPSPYRKPIHVRWRKHVRKFVQKNVLPYIDKWEKQQSVPSSFYRKAYEAGIYASFYEKKYGGTPFEGHEITSENKKDPFMAIILFD